MRRNLRGAWANIAIAWGLAACGSVSNTVDAAQDGPPMGDGAADAPPSDGRPDAPPIACAAPASWPSTKSFIDIAADVKGHSGPDTSCAEVGTLSIAMSGVEQYIWCRRWGGEVRDGAGRFNHWWLWTDLDTGGKHGWVSAFAVSGQGNDEANDKTTHAPIPDCP